jgi:hypothetical protein
VYPGLVWKYPTFFNPALVFSFVDGAMGMTLLLFRNCYLRQNQRFFGIHDSFEEDGLDFGQFQ